MSTHNRHRQVTSVDEQLKEDFTADVEGVSSTQTKQALYHEHRGSWELDSIRDRPHDGEHLHRYFGLTPFYKVLERLERQEHPVVEYPQAYLNALIHVDDAEIWALEDGDLGWFEEQNVPRTRLKVMEWLADHPEVIEVLDDGGTDMHAHSKPGKGKTSFGIMAGVVRMAEVNNETVLWPLPADKSGIVEEVEILPLMPYMTLLVPEGVDVRAEFVPKNPRLEKTTVDVTTPHPFRDVIEYTDPVQILEEIVVPGGLYAILPDPKFRECEKITATNYNTPHDDVDDAKDVTKLRHWDHALMRARAKADQFLHPTLQVEDEFSDLCPMNPRADASDTYEKTKSWPPTYGKARKKGASLMSMSHSLTRIDEDVLEKERWFVTMPQTDVPNSVPGIKNPPLNDDYTSDMPKGEAVVWNSTNFCPVSWANPYRVYSLRGELNIWYPEWQEAMSHV